MRLGERSSWGPRRPILQVMEKAALYARLRDRRSVMAGAAALLVVGYALAWFISSQLHGREQLSAQQRAGFLTDAVLADSLDAEDLMAPPTGERKQLLEAEMAEALDTTIVAMKVRRIDGTSILSVGTEMDPTMESGPRAFEGQAVTHNVSDRQGRPLVATYVPLLLDDASSPDAVVEVYQDAATVWGQFDALRWTLIPAVILGLAVLYVLLMRIWQAAIIQI